MFRFTFRTFLRNGRWGKPHNFHNVRTEFSKAIIVTNFLDQLLSFNALKYDSNQPHNGSGAEPFMIVLFLTILW